MAQIFLRDGEAMLLDDDCLHLFDGKRLYAVSSRNATYAYFGKSGIAHRLICGATDRSMTVDHINGNGLDNRTANLRVVPSAINVKNRQRSRSKASGLPPGIFSYRGGYMVQITNDYKKIFVGVFSDLIVAISALNSAREGIGRPPVA